MHLPLHNKSQYSHFLIGSYDLLDDRHIDDVIKISFLLLYCIKQIDCMMPCVCSVIDQRRRQNVVRTLVTHSAIASGTTFCSYHIVTSSVIYYSTDARLQEIYLFYIIKKQKIE